MPSICTAGLLGRFHFRHRCPSSLAKQLTICWAPHVWAESCPPHSETESFNTWLRVLIHGLGRQDGRHIVCYAELAAGNIQLPHKQHIPPPLRIPF